MAGCKGAKRILAINTDPEAPILASADYAVIGDLHEVVPAISAELRKAREAEHVGERRIRGRARPRLVPEPDGQLGRTARRLPQTDEPREENDAATRDPGGDRDRDDERDRGCDARAGAQAPWAFLSSAEIAGTTSCRSPITA